MATKSEIEARVRAEIAKEEAKQAEVDAKFALRAKGNKASNDAWAKAQPAVDAALAKAVRVIYILEQGDEEGRYYRPVGYFAGKEEAEKALKDYGYYGKLRDPEPVWATREDFRAWIVAKEAQEHAAREARKAVTGESY
jgi:hypothetical protein